MEVVVVVALKVWGGGAETLSSVMVQRRVNHPFRVMKSFNWRVVERRASYSPPTSFPSFVTSPTYSSLRVMVLELGTACAAPQHQFSVVHVSDTARRLR